MKKKTTLYIVLACIIAVAVLSSLAIAVNAAEPNFFESVFSPFGSSLERVYARFSILIDAAIYLIIFLGLAQATIGRKFEHKKGGKAITVGIGLVLAVGLALFERQAGFNIASFGPVAALVLLALMGYAIWIGIKTLEIEGVDTLTMTAITYILVYYSMTAVVPNIIQWINRHIPIIGALLALLAAVFTIYLLVKIVMWIIGLFGLGKWGGRAVARPPGKLPPPTPSRRCPTDPPTPPGPIPSGINPKAPGPRPTAPREPKKPRIPDERKIFIDLSPDFSGIRSQDSLGACSAFAATSIFEYILHVGYGVPKKYLAPLFLWYKTRQTLGAVDIDTGPRTCVIPMESLVKDGVCFEDLWSFEHKGTNKWKTSPDRPAEDDAVRKKIIEFRSLDRYDPDQWVYELLDRNPVNIAGNYPIDMFKPYNKKFYDHPNPTTAEGHAMVIVGYHSHYPHKGKGVKAFKIRNSHDVDWGEHGYTWIPADTLKKILDEDPLVIKGWQKGKEKPVYDKKLLGTIEKIKKFSREEKEWTASEFKYLEELLEHLKEGRFGNAVKLVSMIGRSEGKVFQFNKRLDKTLEKLISELPEEYAAQCRKIKDNLSLFSKNILSYTSRYTGSLREAIEKLMSLEPKRKKELISAKAKKEAKEAREHVLKIVGGLIVWTNGLQAELQKLENIEDYLFPAQKKK